MVGELLGAPSRRIGDGPSGTDGLAAHRLPRSARAHAIIIIGSGPGPIILTAYGTLDR